MARHLRMGALVLALGAGIGPGAMAEPLDYRAANRALPSGDGAVARVVAVPFLDEQQRTIVAGLRQSIPYYGALALSPDEGLFVEWLQASGQHHTVEAARAAALAHCDANRNRSSARCVIVLEVVPKGYQVDATLSLSQPAADALRDGYRKMRGAKAFAISASTGTFGFGATSEAAIAACSEAVADAKSEDCAVIVAD